jgi:hypothetical protein
MLDVNVSTRHFWETIKGKLNKLKVTKQNLM